MDQADPKKRIYWRCGHVSKGPFDAQKNNVILTYSTVFFKNTVSFLKASNYVVETSYQLQCFSVRGVGRKNLCNFYCIDTIMMMNKDNNDTREKAE